MPTQYRGAWRRRLLASCWRGGEAAEVAAAGAVASIWGQAVVQKIGSRTYVSSVAKVLLKASQTSGPTDRPRMLVDYLLYSVLNHVWGLLATVPAIVAVVLFGAELAVTILILLRRTRLLGLFGSILLAASLTFSGQSRLAGLTLLGSAVALMVLMRRRV